MVNVRPNGGEIVETANGRRDGMVLCGKVAAVSGVALHRKAAAVSGVAVLALSLTGCGSSFEGSGSKDAASAEQLALRIDDPWAVSIQSDTQKKAQGNLTDGVYTGVGLGMDGLVTVTLMVQDNRITCLETTQEGETQSVGGYEAIRDGRYAAMIDAAQGADIDAISGATITTAGVRQAVADALDQAEKGQARPAAEAQTASEAASEGATDAKEKEAGR